MNYNPSIATNLCREYRFGFNGQEKDDEVSGQNGSNYTAQFWEYDSRIGRRWNLDPVTYAWQSSYTCFNDNPVIYSDPDGRFGRKKKAEREQEKMADKIDPKRVGDVYNSNEGTDKKADWGFQIYDIGDSKYSKSSFTRDNDGNITGVEISADKPSAWIFNKDNIKNFERYRLGEKSEIENGLEMADEFSKEWVAPLFVKLFTPTSMIDGFKTLITGVDLNGNNQNGTWNRVISPVISIGSSVLFVLNYAKIVSIADKTVKTVDRINKTNTGISGFQEFLRIHEEKQPNNEKDN